MSRQSKNAKKRIVAKQFSEIRKNGGKGPSQTKPVHGKKNVKWKEKNKVVPLAEKSADTAAAPTSKSTKYAKDKKAA